ncbi:pilus assembly protein TadG-related protein [Pseudomonas wadenswilerensis]
MSPLFAKRQRGAIGLVAVLTLATAMVFGLLAVDGGRLYMEQRSLQRVVDMAALEAAGQRANCTGTGTQAAAVATASAARNGFTAGNGNTLVATCGSVATGAASLRSFSPDASRTDAIRVQAHLQTRNSVAAGLWDLIRAVPGAENTILHATAVATPPLPPLAVLTIRSNLLNVDTARSNWLNGLFSQLLGGQLTINAAGWQGLIDSRINLLDYLQQLAIDLNLSAGNYEQLLNTNIAATELVDAMIKVATRAGNTADVLTSLNALKQASLSVPSLVLGTILDVQTGTPDAGLDTDLQLFQLVESFIQLAGKANAAVVDAKSVSIPGLLNVNLKLSIIEPAQISSIGDPRLAQANPYGPNQIFVRTAQVRTYLSIQLPVLATISGVTTALTDLVGPLVGALNSLLHLDLVGTINSALCLLGAGCEQIDLLPLPTPRIDINLEVASGSSRVTGYTCSPNKTLTAETKTSAVSLRLGTIDPTHVFDSANLPETRPLALIDIGTKTCRKILGIGTCDARKPFTGGGLGIKIDTTVGSNGSALSGSSQSLVFTAPPNLNQPPQYLSTSNPNIVQSLRGTLNGVKVEAFKSPTPNILGDLLAVAASVLAGLNSTLGAFITNTLSPLLDPLLQNVLTSLGVTVNQVDVGANLQCSGRPNLVI